MTKHLDKIKLGRSDPSKPRLVPEGRQEKNLQARPQHKSQVRMKKIHGKRTNLQPEGEEQIREEWKT